MLDIFKKEEQTIFKLETELFPVLKEEELNSQDMSLNSNNDCYERYFAKETKILLNNKEIIIMLIQKNPLDLEMII